MAISSQRFSAHKTQQSPARQSKPTTKGGASATAAPLSLQRALGDPTQLRPADVLYLQRTIGNRATGRLLQAKLTLGPAGDKYEQEADRTAKQVMELFGRPCAGGATGRDRR